MPDLSIATGVSTVTQTSTPGGANGAVDFTNKEYGDAWTRVRTLAKSRFNICVTAWSHIRAEANIDREFYAGQQWDPGVESDRRQAGRPCLTINRMPQFVKQVTNEQRQNRPSIQINPVDDSTVDDAEILEGMCRHIQVDSEADAAYDTASQAQTIHGWGFIRVLTEFLPRSFDQKIKIARVKDAFKVYPDPYCQELDFADARYWFQFEDIPIDEYRAMYPKSAVATMSDYASTGDSNWFPTQCVRICEYFWVEDETFDICQWADGTVHRVDESPEEQVAESIARRTETVRVINWVKMNAVEPLAGFSKAMAGKKGYTTDGFKIIPGPYIPIVPVLGDEYIVDNRTQYSGMVRFARDAQRQYNFMRTAAVEMIALAPKAPYVMAEGQDENHEADWKQANVRNLSRLLYKPVALGNQLAPPPQRNAVEPPIQAITMAINQAEHDLMATMGLYQPSLGAVGPEQSGKAILARQSKGDTANFNYSDNFARALRHLGRIILGWIPVYYDVPRMLQIVKPDGTHATVPGNQPYIKDAQGNPVPLKDGVDPGQAAVLKHDLVNFRGTVTISAGPSYSTKRQEAASSILQMVQQFPQLMSVAGDLLVGNFDWHGAREISKRLKAMLPPAVQAIEQTGDMSPEAIAQMMVKAQALQAEVQALQTKLATKAPELQSKMDIALLQALAGIREAEIKKGIADGKNDADQMSQILDLAHKSELARQSDAQDERLQQMQQQHDAALAQAQAGHEAAMQGAQQGHAADMAGQQQQHEQDLAAAQTEPPAGA